MNASTVAMTDTSTVAVNHTLTVAVFDEQGHFHHEKSIEAQISFGCFCNVNVKKYKLQVTSSQVSVGSQEPAGSQVPVGSLELVGS